MDHFFLYARYTAVTFDILLPRILQPHKFWILSGIAIERKSFASTIICTPTFGYFIDTDSHYQIDPITAPVVLDMFTRYDKGQTMKEIRDHLNQLGVTSVRGKPIDLNFVTNILHNRKFIGEYKYREIVVPKGIPAIVPDDLFESVQERMEKNKRAPARHKAEDDYLLSTKLFMIVLNRDTRHFFNPFPIWSTHIIAHKKVSVFSRHKIIYDYTHWKLSSNNIIAQIQIKEIMPATVCRALQSQIE